MPKIAVYGLWHLGSVTAACLAEKGFDVIGIDTDSAVVAALNKGNPPLYEPGLKELVSKAMASKKLAFDSDISRVSEADIVWVTLDTPVDDNDQADVGMVEESVAKLFPYLKEKCVVLISSQLPAGSTQKLQQQHHKQYKTNVSFAYSPENLRLGKAIDVFNNPERIIIGTNDEHAKRVLQPVLSKYSDNLIWMKTESAEMVKHSLNAFLATCITFINEIASLCEAVGADAEEVERGLRSEPRIGTKAYVKPGSAFAGGTLARDINYLNVIAGDAALNIPLLGHIIESNQTHKNWVRRKLTEGLKNLNGKVIAVLGLAYTAGTSTLRRSFAVELCLWLHSQGAKVKAYDPNVVELPEELRKIIALSPDVHKICDGADVLVIANEHPEYKKITANDLKSMKTAFVIDQNGWLSALQAPGIHYQRLGKTNEKAA